MDKPAFHIQKHENKMGNIFKEDFRDFISCLNDCDVKYILVGGYSVFFMVIQGLPEIWIFGWKRTSDNYKRSNWAFLCIWNARFRYD